MVELTRVMSHLASFGWWLNDLGAFFTPLVYALEEREYILDLFEMASGSRMMCNYMRFGGVAAICRRSSCPWRDDLVLDRLPRKVDEFDSAPDHERDHQGALPGCGCPTAGYGYQL